MKRKYIGKIILIIILLAAFVVLTNPKIIPFMDSDTIDIAYDIIKDVYGFTADIEDNISLIEARVLIILSVIVLVSIIGTILKFILDKIKINNNRSKTIFVLVRGIAKYLLYFLTIIWCLKSIGVNVAGIFAGIGLLSLIIGFSAQSLIEDIITGIFIIFEGQYNIGDVIVLDDFRGTVKKIGVRTTSIEDEGGNLKIVNNSDIRNFQNRSQAASLAVCDVGIPYSMPIEKAEQILRKITPEIQKNNSHIFKSVLYKGVEELGENAVILRIVAHTDEARIFDARRLLNREIKKAFEKEGITIPFKQMDIHA